VAYVPDRTTGRGELRIDSFPSSCADEGPVTGLKILQGNSTIASV
jgi:hypothetical protein